MVTDFGKRGWSGRRDSNPRPSPWQGDALPLSYFRSIVNDYASRTPILQVLRFNSFTDGQPSVGHLNEQFAEIGAIH